MDREDELEDLRGAEGGERAIVDQEEACSEAKAIPQVSALDHPEMAATVPTRILRIHNMYIRMRRLPILSPSILENNSHSITLNRTDFRRTLRKEITLSKFPTR